MKKGNKNYEAAVRLYDKYRSLCGSTQNPRVKEEYLKKARIFLEYIEEIDRSKTARPAILNENHARFTESDKIKGRFKERYGKNWEKIFYSVAWKYYAKRKNRKL